MTPALPGLATGQSPPDRLQASGDTDLALAESADVRPYRHMADMMDSLQIGVCLFDDQDRQILWNRMFLRLFPEHAGHISVGEPYATNLRRFYSARLPPEQQHSIEEHIAVGIHRHRTQTMPFIFEHRGQWLRVAAEPVPGLGRLRVWTPIAKPDPTAIKPLAWDDLLPCDVMPFTSDDGDGASMADADGRIVQVNRRFVQLFRLNSPQDAIGRTTAELFIAVWSNIPNGDYMIRRWRPLLEESERFTGIPFEAPLPGEQWVRVLPQRRADGTVVSSIADITPMKRLQHQLEEARETAERANRAKDEFLATVSHELRTPMNGILGMLDVLDDGRLTRDQAERLGIAHQSAEALLSLLDDILTFSRLAAGRIAVEPVLASPETVVSSSARLVQPRAAEKGVALRWTVAPNMPAKLRFDPDRLRQVLLNLLGNAIKFTEQGEISVTAAMAAPRTDGRLTLMFTVTDTGIGIPPAATERIFQPFVQADARISRRYGGTGLGLAICRQLVGTMGGTISVSSTEGMGSTFQFTIACDAPEPEIETAAPAADAPLPPLRVLVVDDNSVNRQVAKLHLECLGSAVTTASSGAEALLACEKPFDLILLDLQMPEMDGYETARALRGSSLPNATTPIVALTAHVGEDHQQRCRAVGMQGFIKKPIRLQSLAKEIGSAIGLNTASAPATEEPVMRAPVLDQERFGSLAAFMPPATLRLLLDEFAAQVDQVMTQIPAAIAEGRPHRHAAHALKGAAWNLGAQWLGDLMHDIELHHGPEAQALLGQFEAVAADTLTAMRRAGEQAGRETQTPSLIQWPAD